ncbi:MAG: hypothetical protein KAS32_28480 [Candidatus Peribacteraceae bacterium]|nr:hypothetical protein [Candidatus Peribacteraceae bacterium]
MIRQANISKVSIPTEQGLTTRYIATRACDEQYLLFFPSSSIQDAIKSCKEHGIKILNAKEALQLLT